MPCDIASESFEAAHQAHFPTCWRWPRSNLFSRLEKWGVATEEKKNPPTFCLFPETKWGRRIMVARQTDWWTDSHLDKIESSKDERALIFQFYCIIYTWDEPAGSARVLLGEWRVFQFSATYVYVFILECVCVCACVIGEAVDERQRWKKQPGGFNCEIHLLVVPESEVTLALR